MVIRLYTLYKLTHFFLHEILFLSPFLLSHKLVSFGVCKVAVSLNLTHQVCHLDILQVEESTAMLFFAEFGKFPGLTEGNDVSLLGFLKTLIFKVISLFSEFLGLFHQKIFPEIPDFHSE